MYRYEYRLLGLFKLWTLGWWKNKKEARSRIRWFARPFIWLKEDKKSQLNPRRNFTEIDEVDVDAHDQ